MELWHQHPKVRCVFDLCSVTACSHLCIASSAGAPATFAYSRTKACCACSRCGTGGLYFLYFSSICPVFWETAEHD